MKKQLLTLTLAAALTLPMAQPAEAASSVKVHLPDFKVTLNGTVINNDYSQYPLIVYNDITYFPMTYYDCRFLGLETAWESAKTGLFIDTSDIRGAYTPYKQNKKNARNSTAQIAAFPVTVNGQRIDNAKEKYPLLIYRDVTYFPMTWRFGVEEFNWKYTFDAKNGLVINSPNAATTETGTLPEQTMDSSFKYGAATDGEYVYYVGGDTADKIMCAPLNNIKKAKKIYDIPINYEFNTPAMPSLYEKNGQVILTYHIGGALMGSNHSFILSPSGASEFPADYETITVGGTTVQYYKGIMPGAGNLGIKQNNGELKTLGDPNYIYGYNYVINQYSESGAASDSYYLRYDDLYILGFDYATASQKVQNKDYSEVTGIYRVNLKTNETVRVSLADIHVSSFTNDTQYLYYTANNKVYRYDMISGTTDTIPAALDKGYNITEIKACASGGAVFVSANNGSQNQLYLIGENERTQKISETADFEYFTVKGDYAIVTLDDKRIMVSSPSASGDYVERTFINTQQNPYRLLVIDRNGKAVFKSADMANLNSTYITNDTFYYFNIVNMQMCYSELK